MGNFSHLHVKQLPVGKAFYCLLVLFYGFPHLLSYLLSCFLIVTSWGLPPCSFLYMHCFLVVTMGITSYTAGYNHLLKTSCAFIWKGVVFSSLPCSDGDIDEAGELAQQLRALPALAENLGLTFRTHMAAHNPLWLQLLGPQCPLLVFVGSGHACGIHTHKIHFLKDLKIIIPLNI